MHNSLFINNMYVTLQTSTCFEHQHAHLITASGIVTLCKRLYSAPVESRLKSALNQCTVQPFAESDVTRCCENTIGSPEDGHVNAPNMSRIVV